MVTDAFIKAKKYYEKHGLVETIKRVFYEFKKCGAYNMSVPVDWMQVTEIKILTTKHCLYVAELIKTNLERIGVEGKIEERISDNENSLYIVICPQMFARLPKRYIAFQMEQTVSSRWLTRKYLRILNNAIAVWDYSLCNIAYWQENNKIPIGKLFYMPINYNKSIKPVVDHQCYDVLFYGDVHNERRKRYIEAIGKEFRVKVVNNIFGDELRRILAQTKVLVNIHYYENALLETTRIYEALSYGNCIIVSEESFDNESELELRNIVDFVPQNNVEIMMDRIRYWLNHEEEREDKVANNKALLDNVVTSFEFYFFRFFLAMGMISFETFYNLANGFIEIGDKAICLSLKESLSRRKSFEEEKKIDVQYFPGLRHSMGWIGCGMSYKFLFKKAMEKGIERLIVCEDDTEFPDDFNERFDCIGNYLAIHEGEWDVFSGLMSDIGDVKISKVDKYGSEIFVYMDKMISMVFNVYSSTFFIKAVEWDETCLDIEKNTIDRYLESNTLKVITTSKFLVNHKEELTSTIWGAENSIYNKSIKDSRTRLLKKLYEFENECDYK